jgi:uncharacterized membrane protein YhaH (DUF805 family)
MAINLNKPEEKTNWYYSKNGNQIGPLELNELLTHIDRYTMVWREGIDWTTASLVPELSGYFKGQSAVENNIAITSNTIGSTQPISIAPAKKMFASPFSFDGRIRRTEYGISFIIYAIIYAFVLQLSLGSAFQGIIFILLIWFMLAQGAKRCHDRNNSGWYQIIPFYFFWMIFAEGDKFTNNYGESPK